MLERVIQINEDSISYLNKAMKGMQLLGIEQMQHLHHMLIQVNTQLQNEQYEADRKAKALQMELKDLKVQHRHEMEEMRIRNDLKTLTQEKEMQSLQQSKQTRTVAGFDQFCNDLIGACEEVQSKHPMLHEDFEMLINYIRKRRNTLSFIDLSKNSTKVPQLKLDRIPLQQDHPMPNPLFKESAIVMASASASVNQAILCSENSIQQLFSSLDRSKAEESQHFKKGEIAKRISPSKAKKGEQDNKMHPLRNMHNAYRTGEDTQVFRQQISQIFANQIPSDQESVISQVQQRKKSPLIRIQDSDLQSVNQDKSRIYFGENQASDMNQNKGRFSNLSPINWNEKRIPAIPSDLNSLGVTLLNQNIGSPDADDFRSPKNVLILGNILINLSASSPVFSREMSKQRDQQDPYDDSIIEQLNRMNTQTDDEKDKKNISVVKEFMDAPFNIVPQRVPENAQEDIRNPQNDVAFKPSELQNKQEDEVNNLFWDLRQESNQRASKSKVDSRRLSDSINVENRSPFATNIREEIIRSNQAKTFNNEVIGSTKINLKKNQIKYYNLNGLISSMVNKNQLEFQEQNRNGVQSSKNHSNPNNNFIEVNNSVIIVQNGGKGGAAKRNNQGPAIFDGINLDRPFSEMRRLKQGNNSLMKSHVQQIQQNFSIANTLFSHYMDS